MTPKNEFHSGARSDFDDAFNWYAERSTNAAIAFVASVDSAIDQIASDPLRWTVVAHGCRCRRLPKYPHNIIYFAQGDRITIIAVAHSKRRPGYWSNRVPPT